MNNQYELCLELNDGNSLRIKVSDEPPQNREIILLDLKPADIKSNREEHFEGINENESDYEKFLNKDYLITRINKTITKRDLSSTLENIVCVLAKEL